MKTTKSRTEYGAALLRSWMRLEEATGFRLQVKSYRLRGCRNFEAVSLFGVDTNQGSMHEFAAIARSGYPDTKK